MPHVEHNPLTSTTAFYLYVQLVFFFLYGRKDEREGRKRKTFIFNSQEPQKGGEVERDTY